MNKYKKTNIELGFKYKEISSNDKWSPGFTLLEKYIGSNAVCIIMKLLNYDEWKETVFCRGFQCNERVFINSGKNYCKICWAKFKKEGFELCLKCMLLRYECYHCMKCNSIKCKCYNGYFSN